MYDPYLTKFYEKKNILVTGHTGFKGSWLTLWLQSLGAQVTGLSIDIPTEPSMFKAARINEICENHDADIADYDKLYKIVASKTFDVVFHLAAQPLVRESYKRPLETLMVNVNGTANLLEALRSSGQSAAVVVVTSDKCYSNHGQALDFSETDHLGGHDPYSMSKAAAELVAASWRDSYFSDGRCRIATARAGNVIGGGDWAKDRIFTDCFDALSSGTEIRLRNPRSTRPWQHVLDPLAGYLLLAARLCDSDYCKFTEAWNFGPSSEDVRSVADVACEVISNWGSGSWVDISAADHPLEASTLSLNCEKARQILGWRPVWDFEKAVAETVSWHKNFMRGCNVREQSIAQISTFMRDSNALRASRKY